jgi:hypothetical protein
MKSKMRRRQFVMLLAILLCAAAAFVSGCEQYCASAEESYRQALAAEHTELAEPEELSGDSPSQFGLSIKAGLIGDILNIVLQPTLELAMNAVSSVDVAGESVDLSSRGQLLELEVAASPACEHCFGIGANLGGEITAEVDGWGSETASLGGSMSIVAPLLLERGEEADAALKLDLPAFVEIGRASIVAQLGGVDSDLADLLEGPLSRIFTRAIARHLDPVTLVEFDAPSFGIPGFEILPVELVTNGETGTVFAGFATNIEALNAPGAPSVAPIVDLGPDENFAFAFQPAIISHSLSLLIDDGQVSRTYNLSGEAKEDGNAHVTLGDFRVGPEVLRPSSGVDADAGYSYDTGYSADASTSTEFLTYSSAIGATAQPDIPFALGFDVFNLTDNATFCFGFGAEAVGGVSVRNNALEVDLIDVRFTNDALQENLVELSAWAGADFIQESHNLVSQSLSKTTVSVPGTDLTFGNIGLGLRPNAVVLRAQSTPSAAP